MLKGRRLDAEDAQHLLRRLLLGRLLRVPHPDAELLAVDDRGAREATAVRRALDLEDAVGDRLPPPRERFLQLGLVIDMARQRVLDPRLEGRDDRRFDGLKAVLEVERRERRLE